MTQIQTPGQEKVLTRSETFDQILAQLSMIETSATKISLRELAQKYLQDITLLSELAEEVFWKLLKIPSAYSLKVPVALRKEMVREALSRLEIADQQTDCWIFEINNKVHLLSVKGFSEIAGTLKELKDSDTILDIQGDPLDDLYRVIFRGSGDLGFDVESPIYVAGGITLTVTGVKPTTFGTGFYRQTCLSSWLEPVPNSAYYKAAGKPGKMTTDRFKEVYDSLSKYAVSLKDTRKMLVDSLHTLSITDPTTVLSDAKTKKVLAKGFAKYVGSIVTSLSLDSREEELPTSIVHAYDLVRIAIWSSREYKIRLRIKAEKQVWDFTRFLLLPSLPQKV